MERVHSSDIMRAPPLNSFVCQLWGQWLFDALGTSLLEPVQLYMSGSSRTMILRVYIRPTHHAEIFEQKAPGSDSEYNRWLPT